MVLANPARDELDVLGAEIEDEHGAFCGIGIGHEWVLEREGIRAGSDWLPRCVPSLPALGVLENGSGESTSVLRSVCSDCCALDRAIDCAYDPPEHCGDDRMSAETQLPTVYPACLVQVRAEAAGQFTARLVGQCELSATAPTRAEAIEQLRGAAPAV